MTGFELLQSITSAKTFSEIVFDLIRYANSPLELTDLLSQELTEEQLQTVKSIADDTNYPLSFSGKQ